MSRLCPLCPLLLAFALLGPITPLSAQKAPPPSRVDTALYSALEWREIGPFRGGRVTAVAGHADEPYVFYFGATGGGVWKTTDGGANWTAVTDSALGAGSIGAIAVAPSDANVVYVGTGESPVRGNVSPGDGMYKSTDAGKTWRHIGLSDAGQIADIEVHPKDENLVYVAVLGHAFGPNATRGVFRSRDGGRTWDKILFRSDSAGAIDLALDPVNPRILYAAFWQVRRGPWYLSSGGAGSGLFKSTDGGETWTEITLNEGLPKEVIGKIGVTVSPLNHERVWAIVEADSGGVFRSEDGGQTWRRTNEERNLRQRAWYYTHIHADPQNVDAVYVLNTGFYRSVDGGKTFTPIRTPHGDNHALWIAPNDARRMINGNDGGANVSFNGGATWSRQDNQPTAQFYHVTTTTHFPYRVCGAQQDNSTVCIASRTTGAAGIDRTDWYPVGGCESGYISARRDDPDVTFAGCYHGMLERHDVRTGQERNVSVWPDYGMGHGAEDLKYRFNWTFPIVHSPQNPNVLYASANVLFKSTDDGQSWTPISPDLTRNDKSKQGSSGGPITKDNTSIEYYDVIFAVAPSPHDSNTIWAGTDDGVVQITRDGGKNWTNVTPRDLPEWALISIVEASPHEAGAAYVAATRYKLDDFRPYIYKTTDYGRTWRRITAGIPDNHFIRVVREDPVRRGLLYAGGEFGVYVSFDDGGAWQPLRLNLPVVPIHDLVVNDNDLIAATHGRSFWILDDVTPLRQLGAEVARADRHLFKPRDVWRVRSAGGGGGEGPAQPRGIGRNPPTGAVVFAYFRQKPEGEVTLELLDARDSVIRRLSTRPRAPTDSLRVSAGMNRFVWNLRYADASRFEGMILWGGGTQGPVALPGRYKARLRAGSWSAMQDFAVKKDPRVDLTEADLRRQFDLLISIRNRLSDANDAVRRIHAVKEQLDAVAKRVPGRAGVTTVSSGADGEGSNGAQQADLAAEAESLKAKLSAIEGEIYQVKNRSNQDPLNYPIKLNNRISWLAGVVGSADAPPTEQAVRVFEELSAALQVQLDRLKVVLETDVPAFNRRVRELEVPTLVVP